MGTVGSRVESFDTRIHPAGLDLKNGFIGNDYGTYVASAASQFRQGQWLRKVGDEVSQVTAEADRPIIGVAKWNKMTLGVSLRVDEPIVVRANTLTTSLPPHGPLVATTFVMRTGTLMSGTALAETPPPGANTCFVLNETTAVITWGTGATFPAGVVVGSTVYASYSYQLVATDYDFDGMNYRTSNDDVTRSANRVAVITGRSRLFNTEFDSHLTYAVGDMLYVAATAIARNGAAGAAQQVGRVFQLPTATYRFLGMDLHGDPV